MFRRCFLWVAIPAFAQRRSVSTSFVGLPEVRSSNSFGKNGTASLSSKEAEKALCSIQKVNDSYRWVSREGKEMVRSQSGAYITFTAIDGSGYVKVLDPSWSELVGKIPFDYLEHLHVGLATLTYWGKTQQLEP